MTGFRGSVNVCPVCWHDHLEVPPEIACPEHGHQLQLWHDRLECPAHRCRYSVGVQG